jgi:NitT/TauT family transport system permease protein
MTATQTPTPISPAAPQASTSALREKFDLRERPEILLVPASFIVLVVTWEFLVGFFEMPAYILPPPSDIYATLVQQLNSANFYNNLRVTSIEILAGYGLGATFAFIIAIGVVQSRLVEKTIFPYVVALQAVPKVALAPLFVIWFGFGIQSKIVVAALVSFFPILVNTIDGLRSANPDLLELLRSLGASKRQIFIKVKLPNSMPFVFAGLDIGIVFAVIGAVVGEFVGAKAGLGFQMLQYIYNFDIAGLFAIIIVLSGMGLFGHLVVRALQRRFAGWASPNHVIGS